MTLMRQSKQQKHGLQNGQQITSKMGLKDGSPAWRSALTLMETTLKSRLIVSINYKKLLNFAYFFNAPHISLVCNLLSVTFFAFTLTIKELFLLYYRVTGNLSVAFFDLVHNTVITTYSC